MKDVLVCHAPSSELDPRLRVPFSMMAVGCSYSGKTRFVLDLLRQQKFMLTHKFSKIVWASRLYGKNFKDYPFTLFMGRFRHKRNWADCRNFAEVSCCLYWMTWWQKLQKMKRQEICSRAPVTCTVLYCSYRKISSSRVQPVGIFCLTPTIWCCFKINKMPSR